MKRSFLWLLMLLLTGLLPGGYLAVAEDEHKSAKETEAAKTEEKAKQIVAVFRLKGGLSETPTDESFPFGGQQSTAPKDLVQRMQKAAADKDVKAVVITLSDFGAGYAQIEELRQAIAGMRAAGKDVYAHSDSLGMGEYGLLCGATQLSVVPTGDLWITGLSGESLH